VHAVKLPALKGGASLSTSFIKLKISPFSVIPRVGGESRKSLKTLDPPVNPSMILRAVSMSNGPGDDDIITLIKFRKDLFSLMTLHLFLPLVIFIFPVKTSNFKTHTSAILFSNLK
jgi:hypothetical protein